MSTLTPPGLVPLQERMFVCAESPVGGTRATIVGQDLNDWILCEPGGYSWRLPKASVAQADLSDELTAYAVVRWLCSLPDEIVERVDYVCLSRLDWQHDIAGLASPYGDISVEEIARRCEIVAQAQETP